mmetsp:Transcript_12678/g.41790  ORF Transcript_12678/g.41790 Transcript_12678/m.41790 type:complete len:226 (+) Transcript_12678:2382-3059(+)
MLCTTAAPATQPAWAHCAGVPPRKSCARNAPVKLSPAPVVSVACTRSAGSLTRGAPSLEAQMQPCAPSVTVASRVRSTKKSSARCAAAMCCSSEATSHADSSPVSSHKPSTSAKASCSLQKARSTRPRSKSRRNSARQMRTTSKLARSSDVSAPAARPARRAASTISGRNSAYPSMCTSDAPSMHFKGTLLAFNSTAAPRCTRIVRCPSGVTRHSAVAVGALVSE